MLQYDHAYEFLPAALVVAWIRSGMRRVPALIFLCLVAPAPAAPIDPHNPPEGRFSDEWMEVYFGDQKVGYAHSTMNRRKDVVQTETRFVLEMGRADQPIKIAMTQTTTETLDGVPLEFGSNMDLSTVTMKSRGVIRDGTATITNTQFGMDVTNSYPFPEGALMGWGLFRESMIRGFKSGTEYKIDVYAPELRLDGPTQAFTTIGESETFDYRGQKREGQRVLTRMDTSIGSMTLTAWVDKDGRPLKSIMPMPGLGDFLTFACDEAVALAEFAPPEFFMNTVIPVKRSLDRGGIREIEYVLKSKHADAPLADFPETGMQKSRRVDDGSVRLTVTRQIHLSRDGSTAGAGESIDLTEFLTSNLMMNLEDPRLVELARQARGDATDPFVVGDRLRRFVTDYVQTKSLNIGFASASEVARTREGDCSEHGVLLAALARLCGIPSRVVVGLAYVPIFGGKDDIYGYHLWTQLFIHGQWYDFDAALRETEVSPARIAFAVSSLKDAGLADLSLPLMGKIGAIDMDITKVIEMAGSSNEKKSE
jgi:hypothetical protein